MATLNRALLGSLAVLSVLVALASYRFLFLGWVWAFPGEPFDTFRASSFTAFAAHVIAAPVALALGAFQIMPRFRAASLGRHRWIGRVYVGAVAIGGLSGAALALQSWDRPLAASGFLVLAVLWLYCTFRAVAHARARQIAQHRAWMIRSFALTTAAITLRIYLAIFMFGFDIDYYEASSVLAWAAWVPNLLFAQWWLSRSNSPAVAA